MARWPIFSAMMANDRGRGRPHTVGTPRQGRGKGSKGFRLTPMAVGAYGSASWCTGSPTLRWDAVCLQGVDVL